MKIIKSTIAVALGVGALSFFVWSGQDPLPPKAVEVLSEDEVRTKIEAMGYDVERIKWDFGQYEVNALTQQGQQVVLDVSAVDARVLREGRK